MTTKKNPKIFLTHILESINEIEKNVNKISETKFYESTTVQDAVIRRLEIIGEAARNMPDSYRKKHQRIPWKKIAGLRDVLIHEYFGVDMELIWKITDKDIPKLKKQIINLLKKRTPSLAVRHASKISLQKNKLGSP